LPARRRAGGRGPEAGRIERLERRDSDGARAAGRRQRNRAGGGSAPGRDPVGRAPPPESIRHALLLDVSIARGLDYYTGAIYETFLDDLPAIGSVCSGGRYDNLAALYTNQDLPGIGASLGLDRLLAAMTDLGLIEPVRTPADVLIAYFDRQRLNDYLRLAAMLRAAGIGVEVYPEPKKLAAQLKYADQRGFRFAIIAGSREFDAGACQVKNMQTGTSSDCPLADGAQAVIATIAGAA
jgi:histidyl-tRNA synthetase